MLKSPFFRYSAAGLLLAGALAFQPLLAETDSANPPTTEWLPASDSVIAKEHFIPSGGETTWKLPQVAPGQRLALRVSARRQTAKLGGYGHYIQYELNSQPLNASINRKVSRLLNKPLFFRRSNGMQVFWNAGDGIWHTFFTPDFQTDTSRYDVKPDQDPYTILIDVTDLLTGSENTFTARNMISPGGGKEIPVVVSVEALTAPGSSLAGAASQAPLLAGRPEVKLDEGGGLSLHFGKVRVPVESRFSWPNGAFNHLGQMQEAEGEKEWKPEVRQTAPNRWEVTAAGASYRLERTIELLDHRVSVRDRYTNLTEEPIGIRIANHFNLKGLELLSCRIGGQANESLHEAYSPGNPTLFLPAREGSLGLVVEDDVLRNHSILYYDDAEGEAGMKDDLFSLKPKADYTASWSVYFTPDSDYYTFINAVRRDWGVNYTLEAPVYFTNYRSIAGTEDEALRKLLAIRQPKYIAFWEVRTPEPQAEWGDRIVMANGTGLYDPSVQEEIGLLRKAIERLRRVAPEVKVTLYTHCFFVSPEKPDSERYRDSWILDGNGQRKRSVYNSPERVDFQTVYPSAENSYGKDYLKLVDFYLNDLGLDWIYWDESTGPGVTNTDFFISSKQDGYSSFGAWDGHTALIHKRKKTIEKPFTMLPLITRPIFAEIIQRVKAKGGFVLFNGAATTRQRIGQPSFTETQDTLTRGYEVHLDSPLGYGYGSPTMGDIRSRLKLGLLYARTHLDYPSEVVSRCYPFTPEELHAGWVKGRERIITSLNGEYGWEGSNDALRLVLFDHNGAKLQDEPVDAGKNGKVAIEVPKGGVAILEKVTE